MRANELLFLRRVAHRVAALRARPGHPELVRGFYGLTRRYDGQPIIALELDTAVALDISVNGGVGDCVSADVTATAYIEDIKYCPFCGEEL